MSSNNFLICLRWRLFAISRFNSRTARPALQAEINFSLRQAQPQMLGPLRDWQSPGKFKLAINLPRPPSKLGSQFQPTDAQFVKLLRVHFQYYVNYLVSWLRIMIQGAKCPIKTCRPTRLTLKGPRAGLLVVGFSLNLKNWNAPAGLNPNCAEASVQSCGK